MYGEQLRHHAEALLDERVELAVAVVRAKDLLDLDPEWGVTEYIRDRWSPANVPYSPTEWTDPPEPPDDQRRTSRDW